MTVTTFDEAPIKPTAPPEKAASGAVLPPEVRKLAFLGIPYYLPRRVPIGAPHVIDVGDSWMAYGIPEGCDNLRLADAVATILYKHGESTLRSFFDIDMSDNFTYNVLLPSSTGMHSFIIMRRVFTVECGFYTHDPLYKDRYTWHTYFLADMPDGPYKPWKIKRWNMVGVNAVSDEINGMDIEVAQVQFAIKAIELEYWHVPPCCEGQGRVTVLDDDGEARLRNTPDATHLANAVVDNPRYYVVDGRACMRDI